MEYVTLASQYFGVKEGQIVGHRQDGENLVVLVNLGIKGTQKHRIPLEDLHALQEYHAPPELLAEIDATDGAMRLMEQSQIDPTDVIVWLGEDKRLTARDVRAYIEEMAK